MKKVGLMLSVIMLLASSFSAQAFFGGCCGGCDYVDVPKHEWVPEPAKAEVPEHVKRAVLKKVIKHKMAKKVAAQKVAAQMVVAKKVVAHKVAAHKVAKTKMAIARAASKTK